MNVKEALKTMLREHEGWRAHPYKCSAGALTIGYGHNLTDKGISKKIGEALLEQDIEDVISDCSRYDWFAFLDGPRMIVVMDMMFNLGAERFAGFKRMIKAIEDRDYVAASVEMLDSRWATQVGRRADRLAGIMRSGVLR